MNHLSLLAPSMAAGRRRILPVRLLAAACQAAALYALLYVGPGEKAAAQAWQHGAPQVFIPLLLAAAYAPIALLLGAGQLRKRPLIRWTVLVALVAAALGYHHALRGGPAMPAGSNALPMPGFRLWLALAAAGFVGQVLATDRHGHDAGAGAAPYVRHFDTAWRMGLQIVLALAFVGVFWLVLYLGAALFNTISLSAAGTLITKRGFALPATTLAFAAALHLTSIQPSLLRAIRVLVLTLFSWLLPLMAAIVAAFLASLLFLRSLQPLWETRHAASLLLGAAVLMVGLINACYQDGLPGHAGQRLRRWAALLGAVELLPLVGLAAWALHIRVRQYGWTADRIVAAAACAMAAWYALGYAASLLRARAWMKRLEATNISAAYLFLALVAALFSPLADPARLMAADQVARLKDGAADPATFDYAALYLDGGRWGMAALNDLAAHASGPAAAVVRERAQQALDAYARSRDDAYHEPDAALLAQAVDVLPAGRTLPDAFLKQETWRRDAWGLPSCAYDGRSRCTARFITLAPGRPEGLLFIDNGSRYFFQPDAQGRWAAIGTVEGGDDCEQTGAAIQRAGTEVRAVPAALPDLMVGGRRLRIVPRGTACVGAEARDAQ